MYSCESPKRSPDDFLWKTLQKVSFSLSICGGCLSVLLSSLPTDIAWSLKSLKMCMKKALPAFCPAVF